MDLLLLKRWLVWGLLAVGAVAGWVVGKMLGYVAVWLVGGVAAGDVVVWVVGMG